jgi:hypothetical protein
VHADLRQMMLWDVDEKDKKEVSRCWRWKWTRGGGTRRHIWG